MAFENLSNKLQEVFKQLRSIALLEADVNFKIVKQFIKKVTERAVGTEVLEGLNPGQQVIKIVNDELIDLMGTTQSKLTFANRPPTIYMMVGLQGAGKTTSSGKLAGLLRKQGKNPLIISLFLKWVIKLVLWKFPKKLLLMQQNKNMMSF